MKKKILIVTGIILLVCIGVVSAFMYYKSINKEDSGKKTKQKENPVVEPTTYNDTNYNVRLMKTVNSTQSGNYLISPYSIEIALNMLRDGANGETKKQIDNVIGTRDITYFNVKDRISVSNAAFIKDKYKDAVKSDYYDSLAKYNAELVFDPFLTPNKINEWVNTNTDGMISKLLDEMDEDFVLGLANAVAIDVEWDYQFECEYTRKEEFTLSDGSKMDVSMMNQSFEYSGSNVKYIKTDDATGIILPYRSYDEDGNELYDEEESNGTQLEFVGILPNDDVNTYMDNLSEEKLEAINNSAYGTDKYIINVGLPKFSYEFELESFSKVLISMGITDVFDEDNADLSNIIDKNDYKKYDLANLYVDTAIHKTYIDLNEKGTKAAAVTYFGINKSSAMPVEKETVKVEFNKPFIYMIRDSKTKEILFFGVVQKPNKWEGSCTTKNEE